MFPYEAEANSLKYHERFWNFLPPRLDNQGSPGQGTGPSGTVLSWITTRRTLAYPVVSPARGQSHQGRGTLVDHHEAYPGLNSFWTIPSGTRYFRGSPRGVPWPELTTFLHSHVPLATVMVVWGRAFSDHHKACPDHCTITCPFCLPIRGEWFSFQSLYS